MFKSFNVYTCFILYLFTSYIYGQNVNEATLEKPQTYTIRDISVTGTVRFESKTIISFSGLTPYQEINIPGEKITDVVKKLWKQQLFKDVNVYASNAKNDSIDIEIVITEFPRLSSYDFEGIDEGDQEDLIKELGLNSGKRITENLIINSRNYIRNKFIKDGYLHTKVDVTAVADDEITEKNVSKLKVNIDLGEKVKIDLITFKNNHSIDGQELRNTMENTFASNSWRFWEFWKWFNSSKYIKDDYEDDKIKILDLYKEKGFRNAKIVSDSIYNVKDNKINIQLTIDEGNRFHHRNISIVGNSKYDTNFLKRLLKIKKGDIYNTSLIQERATGSTDNDDIRSWYLDNGYLFANVSVVESKVENDSIDIEIRIHEGKPATIKKIIIEGNTRTKDHVILREIRNQTRTTI